MEAISRRQAITGVASGILIVAPETAFSYQANSAVSFGVIGTGGRGVYVGTHMANVKGTKIAQFVNCFVTLIFMDDNGEDVASELHRATVPTASWQSFTIDLKAPETARKCWLRFSRRT